MKTSVALAAFLGATVFVLSHPHFNKTVSATLPGGVEVSLAYNTTRANESHARDAAVGAFLMPRGPRLTTSADIVSGGVTIPAGEYTIGVIKNGENDWTMGLYPGRIGRGEAPDMSKVLKLESQFSSSAGTAEHLLIDITPGSGKFEGRAVLTLHFGSMFLAAALS